MVTTNVCRILEKAGIPFEQKSYAYDEDDLSGVHAAQEMGLDSEMVFKTLVAKGDKTPYCVFVIPVAEELDLKKCAAVSGNKRVELIHVKELQPLTGYIRGGCSPVGMKKKLPTFIDETALLLDTIAVSAGQRGEQVMLAPEALMELVGIKAGDLTRV